MLFRPPVPEDLSEWHERPILMEDTTGVVAERDGKVEAVCLLDNWSPNACRIHIWIKNPFVLRRGFKEEVFDFVFSSGRNKIFGETPSDNPKALKFIKHIGFEEIFRVKDAIEVGVDLVITEYTRERYGQENTAIP